MDEDKVRENRLRRWADRLGLMLRKSRSKRLHVNNLGRYRIINMDNIIMVGEKFDLSLDQVESFLEEYEAGIRRAQWT